MSSNIISHMPDSPTFVFVVLPWSTAATMVAPGVPLPLMLFIVVRLSFYAGDCMIKHAFRSSLSIPHTFSIRFFPIIICGSLSFRTVLPLFLPVPVFHVKHLAGPSETIDIIRECDII